MRADLAAITPEALAALSNMGLVKRALRELEAGQTPTMQELSDGTVVATLPDPAAKGGQATCKLPPKVALKDAPCSCGAQGVCRHRIAAVLAYRGFLQALVTAASEAGTGAAAGASGAGEGAAPVAMLPIRQPWEITAEELEGYLGDRLSVVAGAEARGADAEVFADPPTVRFSGCSVRFLAGADLSHARCDCALGVSGSCAHIGLAVRAFQRVGAAGGAVRLGPPPVPMVVPLPALAVVEGFLARFVARGLSDAAGLAQAREAALRASEGLVWLQAALEDLEAQRRAWEQRSALHQPDRVALLLAEAWGRARAARAGGDLGALLGVGEPLVVPLAKVRLISLGARIRQAVDAGGLEAELLFWDGGAVVSWTEPFAASQDPTLLYLPAAKATLAALAEGQVVTRHVERHARKTIELRRGRDTNVLPQRGAWGDIPAPVRVEDFGRLLAERASQPPEILQSRSRTEQVRIVSVAGVAGLQWSPGQQRLRAYLLDSAGAALRVERRYEGFAPGAIAALAEALPAARYVSGWLRTDAEGLVLEPIGVVTSRVIVPDLSPKAPLPPLPLAGPDDPQGRIEQALGALEAELARLAQDGVGSGLPLRSARGLEQVGLGALARAVTALEATRYRTGPGAEAAAAEAWAACALRLQLARALRARAA